MNQRNGEHPYSVLIDDGLSSQGHRSGVGQHSENVAAHMRQFARCELLHLPGVSRLPRYVRKWAYIGMLNASPRLRRYDIVHHMSHYVPLFRGGSLHVATIHDLGIVRMPETVSPAWRWYNRHAFDRAIERADAIVTVSASIREELLSYAPRLHGDRVFVCSSGIREIFFHGTPSADALSAVNLRPHSYFLFVGDLSRRKNLRFLLEAFLEARRRGVVRSDTELILVGKKSWGYHEFEHLVRPEWGVRLAGYVTEEVLVSLYRYSKCVVFPSVYEGFGSPVVEAMSQRTPLIISDIPASLELNDAHGRQMSVFRLGDQEGLIGHLGMHDAEHERIRGALDYGDLSRYSYDHIAKLHARVYADLLARRNAA